MGVWTINLFDCCKNFKTFAISCCPGGICCVQCASAYVSSSGDINQRKKVRNLTYCIAMFFPVCGWIFNRIKLRNQLQINDSILIDIGYTICCPCCAVTQEFMEALDINYERKTDTFVCRTIKESCK